MFCSKCGKELPEGSKFCNKCGASLVPLSGKNEVKETTVSVASSPRTITLPNINYRKMMPFVIIGAVLIALIIIAVVLLKAFVFIPSVSSDDFVNACESMNAHRMIVSADSYLEREFDNQVSNNLEDGFYMTMNRQFLETDLDTAGLTVNRGWEMIGLRSDDIEEISFFVKSDVSSYELGLMMNEIGSINNIGNARFELLGSAQITMSESGCAEDLIDGLSYWLGYVGIDTDDLSFLEYRDGKNSGMIKLHIGFPDLIKAFYNDSYTYELLSNEWNNFEDLKNSLSSLGGSIDVVIYVKGNNIIVVASIAVNKDPTLIRDFCSYLDIGDPTRLRTSRAVADGLVSTCDRFYPMYFTQYIRRAQSAATNVIAHNQAIEAVTEEIDGNYDYSGY